MTTFVYSTKGAKSYQGQFEIELDSTDLRTVIEQARKSLLEELSRNGLLPKKVQFLYSLITEAWMKDYLSEDKIDLHEIEVDALGLPTPDHDQDKLIPKGNMITLTLIPLKGNLQAVKIPYPGETTTSEVIADIRAHYSLGPNSHIQLHATSEGKGSPISSSTEIKDLPSTNIYWSQEPYG
jgi:hypothetical protein